jgi:hypothetical protein
MRDAAVALPFILEAGLSAKLEIERLGRVKILGLPFRTVPWL